MQLIFGDIWRAVVIDYGRTVLRITWEQGKRHFPKNMQISFQSRVWSTVSAHDKTAVCLVLFQEKLLRLLEQWTSLGPCTTSDSLPLPSFITRQSAPRWHPWAACITPRGRLWELVWGAWNTEKLGRVSASAVARQRKRNFQTHLVSLDYVLNTTSLLKHEQLYVKSVMLLHSKKSALHALKEG